MGADAVSSRLSNRGNSKSMDPSALDSSGVRPFYTVSDRWCDTDRIMKLLQTLQGHVDDIRSLIQCGICVRPLYEPYTLACGHTFCYGVSSSLQTSVLTSLLIPGSVSHHGFRVEDRVRHVRIVEHW